METSAGIVVYRQGGADNLFLLLQYPSGHWDFAKGHKERGETNKETAVRELREETGIKNITFLNGFEKRIRYTYKRAGQLKRKQVIFFLGYTTEKDVYLSDEHLGYAWLNYEKSKEQVTFKNAKRILSSAHRFLQVRAKESVRPRQDSPSSEDSSPL